MKRKYALVSILACFFLYSCNKSGANPDENNANDTLPEFSASTIESATKTSLKGLDVIWSANDRVAIFNGTTVSKEYKVKDGCDGTTTTTLTPINNDFTTGTEGSEIYANVAFYPYSAVKSCSKSSDGYMVSVNLSQSIKYSPSSFGGEMMPMVAVTNSKEDHNLSFKNICGLLKLQLKGDGIKVYSVTVSGNSDEKISGAAKIRCAYKKMPTVEYDSSAEKYVCMTLNGGLLLSGSKEVYIPIAPVDFEKGITVRILTDEGEAVKTTGNLIKVERSAIISMREINLNEELDKVSVLKYTTTDNQIIKPDERKLGKISILSNYYMEDFGIITFDGKLESIPASFFSDWVNYTDSKATKLVSVIIPKGVKEIGMQAFEYCVEMKEVSLPEGLETIAAGAFMHGYKLEKINIPESVKTIDDSAFYKDESLKSIKIPEAIAALNRCFSFCSSVESISIPKSISIITANLFEGCYKLKEVVLHDGITKIESNAFNRCTSLVNFKIPKDVTEIGDKAFWYCTRLKNLYVYATIPPALGKDVFITNASYEPGDTIYGTYGNKQTDAILYVSAASIEAYKIADGWKEFKDIRTF